MAPQIHPIIPSSVKGKPHAHSSLVGRHSDSPHHPDLATALSTQPKTSPPPRRAIYDTRVGDGPATAFLSIFLKQPWRLPVAKKPKLLSDLFHDTLKDVYFAENKILKTLPKMAKAAQSKDLKAAFVKHEKETRGQVKRLQQVFNILGKPARAKTCDAILGITDEGAEIMKDYKGMPALDAGLLAAALAVEHYEMSRYGTLRRWAAELGMPDAVALVEATLKEEKATDAALTTLAKSVVNVEAEQVL
jgi:ferritin-like metal-binding protein YciE